MILVIQVRRVVTRTCRHKAQLEAEEAPSSEEPWEEHRWRRLVNLVAGVNIRPFHKNNVLFFKYLEGRSLRCLFSPAGHCARCHALGNSLKRSTCLAKDRQRSFPEKRHSIVAWSALSAGHSLQSMLDHHCRSNTTKSSSFVTKNRSR